MPCSFSSIYRKCRIYRPEGDYNQPFEVLQQVQVDFEGRLVSQSKYVIDDPLTRFAGLKPSDFTLENQQAVGVKPRPVFCSLQRAEIESQIEAANNLVVDSSKPSDNG